MADQGTTRARRVLVVEDEEPVRRVIVRHLERGGFETREAESAEEALTQIFRDREPYDVVLTDVHLPGHSGVQLTRLLLAHSPLKPVVLITADPDEGLAREALGYGASGYLLKPFELFELDGVVQQALGRLELLEATEALARQQAEQLGGEQAGRIPPVWLTMSDERSGAGVGHGYRVARMAGAVIQGLEPGLDEGEREALEIAARVHEVGRLLGTAPGKVELARRSAHFLAELGLAQATATAVRHHFEEWGGGGGPDGLSGGEIPRPSLVLAAVDAIDHRAVERVKVSLDPAGAVREAVDAVLSQEEAVHAPEVCEALRRTRETVEAIWTLTRSAAAAARS